MKITVLETVYDTTMDGTPLQTGVNTAPAVDDNVVVCVTCHRSHGTAAEAATWAASRPRDTGGTGAGSALLRISSRGACYNCHGAAARNTP